MRVSLSPNPAFASPPLDPLLGEPRRATPRSLIPDPRSLNPDSRPYSSLSATTGSMAIARRAGRLAAATPTISSSAAADRNVAASHGRKP